MTPGQLEGWIEKTTLAPTPKGRGPMYSPGHSWRGDACADGEVMSGAYPMAPHQRGEKMCRSIGWGFFDADGVGDWMALSDAIIAQGGALVRSRSSGHCTLSDCALHPGGIVKWHLALPLRRAWAPPEPIDLARGIWKRDLYLAARFTLQLVGGLLGQGFDHQLEQFLCRMYPGAPRDAEHARVSREIYATEGLGFDIEACFDALVDLGVAEAVVATRGRSVSRFDLVDHARGSDGIDQPMVEAFKVDGRYLRALASGKHAVACPWERQHTTGKTGDTSTILFESGKFYCSHSHSEGRAPGGAGMREVLAMLSPAAQAAHRASMQSAIGRHRRGSNRGPEAFAAHHEDGDDRSRFQRPTPQHADVDGNLATSAMLLAALDQDPRRALSTDFARRVAMLPPPERGKIHDRVKALKVALRPYNAAVSAAERVVQQDAAHAESETRISEESRAKPTIAVGPDENRVGDEAVRALAEHPDVYQRGGTLVYVLRDMSPLAGVTRPRGCPRIAPLPNASLRELLSASAVWVERRLGRPTKRVHVPQTVVNAVAARGEWIGVRALEGVVDCPMLRPDGSVISAPGFDAATGLLVVANGVFPEIPERPTQEDARRAAAVLLDLVRDFPFKSHAHRSGWLAALLTMLARCAFRGPAPMFLFDANAAGTGKGKLVGVISAIACGRPMATMAPVEDDAEQRKRITAVAMAGDSSVLIDNVVGTLGGPCLDAALTSSEWSDRLLGSNQTVRLPLAVTWFVTGNNVQVRGDMARRIQHVRLESSLDRPEDRAGFAHADLEEHVLEHRPAFLTAALTILRAYCVAGRPAQGLAPWGSFEGWSLLIRGAIVFSGEPDAADAREELRSETDIAAHALRDLVEGWAVVARRHGGQCTVAQALCEIDRELRVAGGGYLPAGSPYEGLLSAIGELVPTPAGKLPSARQLGNAMRTYKGRAVRCADGSLRALSVPKDTKHGAMWAVRTVGPQGPAVGPDGVAASPRIERVGGCGGSGASASPRVEGTQGEFGRESVLKQRAEEGSADPPEALQPPAQSPPSGRGRPGFSVARVGRDEGQHSAVDRRAP